GPERPAGPGEPCRDLYAQGREDRLQGLPFDERHQRQDEDQVERRDGRQEDPTSPSRIVPWPPHQPGTDEPDDDDRREQPERAQRVAAPQAEAGQSLGEQAAPPGGRERARRRAEKT